MAINFWSRTRNRDKVKQLSNAVRQANRNITLKGGKIEKFSVQQIESEIKTLKDFNRWMVTLKNAKTAKFNTVTKNNVTLTDFERKELVRNIRLVNANLQQQYNKAFEKIVHGKLLERGESLEKIEKQLISLKNVTQADVAKINIQAKRFKKALANETIALARYKDNYLKAVRKELGENMAIAVQKALTNVSGGELFKLRQEEPEFQVEEVYSIKDVQSRINALVESFERFDYMFDEDGVKELTKLSTNKTQTEEEETEEYA